MKTSVKIVWTVIVTVIFFFLSSFAGAMPLNDFKGILCCIVMAAWIGAYFAIWKKSKQPSARLKDYYKILGLPSLTADQELINQAYRHMAKMWHPDLHPGENVTRQMIDINEAAEILRNPEKKARYDAAYRSANFASACGTSNSDINDDMLRDDINTAHRNAESYVKEFFMEARSMGKGTAKEIWKFARPFVYILLAMMCAQFCIGFIQGLSS